MTAVSVAALTIQDKFCDKYAHGLVNCWWVDSAVIMQLTWNRSLNGSLKLDEVLNYKAL